MPERELAFQARSGASRRPVGAVWIALILAGILFRIAIVVIAGNQLRAPWSGGGDAPVYVLLAENLLHGNGFTYAGMPTAMRPPGYPLLLAAFMYVFGSHFIFATRCVQFLLGLATAYFCSRTGALLFGGNAVRPVLAVTLVFPTLVFITGELLTEAVAAFMVAVFFYFAVQATMAPRLKMFVALGVVTSVAALFRFNMALLGIVAIWIALAVRHSRPAWQQVLVVCASAGLVIAPWIVRNEMAFHGQVLYSTHSGIDAVEGVLAPQGRAFPGDAVRIRNSEGWVYADIETNAPQRRRFPSEFVLDHQAWTVAQNLWKEYGWHLVPIDMAKCLNFWLSTDQVFWTQSFSLRQRILRWSGVIAYWILLGLGLGGWLQIRRTNPFVAYCCLFYILLITALHLPFPMITRLRIPFAEPIIAILAGGALPYGASRILAWIWNRLPWLRSRIPFSGPLSIGSD